MIVPICPDECNHMQENHNACHRSVGPSVTFSVFGLRNCHPANFEEKLRWPADLGYTPENHRDLPDRYSGFVTGICEFRRVCLTLHIYYESHNFIM